MFKGLIRRFRYLLRRRQEEQALEEEMRFHRALRRERLCREGVADSDREARVRFGNETLLKERAASMWEWTWLSNLGKDARYSFRSLRRSPVFTAVALLLLALGIGANSAIFSVANVLLLRMLPVRDAQSVFYLHVLPGQPDGASGTGNPVSSFSFHVFTELRKQREIFSSLLAYVPAGYNKISVRAGTMPQEASVEMVSGDFFAGLGVPLVCGGGFNAEDERQSNAVAVLGHSFWASQMGADCDAVGKKVYVKGAPFTVVGIASPRFTGVETTPTDVWIPLQQRPGFNAWGAPRQDYRTQDKWWCLRVIGRLQPGVREKQAEAMAQAPFLRCAYDRLNSKPHAGKQQLRLDLVAARGVSEGNDGFLQSLYILFAMVGVILLIACGNMAMLLVARNAARAREFSIRLAVGGSRGRFFQQLLVESLILVAGGALVGWLFAMSATRVLARWAELEVSLAPDNNVLFFTVLLSLAVGLLFGLAPLSIAWRGAQSDPLRQSAATGFQDKHKAVARRTVLVLQIAMGVVLSVSAALLVKSLRNLQTQELGFQPARLLAFGVQAPPENEQPTGFHQTILDKIRELPGVEAATVVNIRPGATWSNNFDVRVDGLDPRVSVRAASNMVRWNGVGGSYFATLGIPLRAGRDITDADSATAPKVAIVNETFVKQYLQGRTAIGHQISFGRDLNFTVVGIAPDSKYTEIREEPMPMAYLPYRQVPNLTVGSILLRSKVDPAQLLPAIRKTVASLAPNSALLQPMTEEEQFSKTIAGERLMARLALFFGLLALLLVATGLYGTLSYAVNRRTAELGIRMAIGAQRRRVVWMILRENIYVCAAGVALGVPLSFYATGILSSQLFGLSPHDPVVLFLVAFALLCVTVAASVVPAYRASTIDPIRALRYE